MRLVTFFDFCYLLVMVVHASQRIPQQARAVATRARILQAAIQCWLRQGCGQTSTTDVAGEAGVSQGALYKHFGSKEELMAATTENLFVGLRLDFQHAFSEPVKGIRGDSKDKISHVLHELGRVFLSPEIAVLAEIFILSRTDPTLRDFLDPVVRTHRENLHHLAAKIFPEAARVNPRFSAAIDGVLAAFQGAALQAIVTGVGSDAEAFVHYLESVARYELEAPYGGER